MYTAHDIFEALVDSVNGYDSSEPRWIAQWLMHAIAPPIDMIMPICVELANYPDMRLAMLGAQNLQAAIDLLCITGPDVVRIVTEMSSHAHHSYCTIKSKPRLN